MSFSHALADDTVFVLEANPWASRTVPLVSKVCNIFTTKGTHDFLAVNGVNADLIQKLQEGRPNIDDAIKNGQIQLVINTHLGRASQYDDSYIRKAVIKYKVLYNTTIAAACAAAKGIVAFRKGKSGVKSLQEYHADIR
ncbi:MAG: hypothetical protein WCP70_11120 [Methanothrix sp.]